MRIAYVISAHKYPEQVIRLVSRLHTQRASFFIHVDRKSSRGVFDAMRDGLRHFTNVHFVKRHRAFWGEASLLNASLEAIRAIFQSGIEFDRMVLMSGQDYPTRSNEEIERFFQAHADTEFVDWHDFRVEGPPDRNWPSSGLDRVINWHFRLWKMNFVLPGRLDANAVNRYCRSHKPWFPAARALWSAVTMFIPVKRHFPVGIDPFYWGSAYSCLTKECVEYIHGLIGKRHPVFRFFQYVDIADEMFYQSVVMSSGFRPKVVNDNLFCIDWKNPNPLVPRTWVQDDFERLVSAPKLFARKFDIKMDSRIFDMLDQYASATSESTTPAFESDTLVQAVVPSC